MFCVYYIYIYVLIDNGSSLCSAKTSATSGISPTSSWTTVQNSLNQTLSFSMVTHSPVMTHDVIISVRFKPIKKQYGCYALSSLFNWPLQKLPLVICLIIDVVRGLGPVSHFKTGFTIFTRSSSLFKPSSPSGELLGHTFANWFF